MANKICYNLSLRERPKEEALLTDLERYLIVTGEYGRYASYEHIERLLFNLEGDNFHCWRSRGQKTGDISILVVADIKEETVRMLKQIGFTADRLDKIPDGIFDF